LRKIFLFYFNFFLRSNIEKALEVFRSLVFTDKDVQSAETLKHLNSSLSINNNYQFKEGERKIPPTHLWSGDLIVQGDKHTILGLLEDIHRVFFCIIDKYSF
jgi:hypothetical protein